MSGDLTANAGSGNHRTSDSESNGDSIPVQISTGIASVAASVVSLNLCDRQCPGRRLGDVCVRAELNLFTIQQPRDL